MSSGGYPLIYITEPNRGRAVLNIAPGDHTCQQYELTPSQILGITEHLLSISRIIMCERRMISD